MNTTFPPHHSIVKSGNIKSATTARSWKATRKTFLESEDFVWINKLFLIRKMHQTLVKCVLLA